MTWVVPAEVSMVYVLLDSCSPTRGQRDDHLTDSILNLQSDVTGVQQKHRLILTTTIVTT